MDSDGTPAAGGNYDALFKLVLIGDSGVGKVSGREKERVEGNESEQELTVLVVGNLRVLSVPFQPLYP